MIYDGYFRLCSSLCHKDCIYDLRKGNLTYGWNNSVPEVRNMAGKSEEYLNKCNKCPLIKRKYAYLNLSNLSRSNGIKFIATTPHNTRIIFIIKRTTHIAFITIPIIATSLPFCVPPLLEI